MSTEVAETTETVVVNEEVSYLDSDDNALTVGATVRVSTEVVYGKWNEDTRDFDDVRDMDWGTVKSLNEDGTVNVNWNGCGCFVDPEDDGRVEKASDLTLSNDNEQAVYDIGLDKGHENGEKANQSRLRRALGLSNQA